MYEEIFDGIKELRVMSQEKVDQYKKEKANRKQNMRKEKLHNVLRKCMVGLVGVLLVGWIGWSASGMYEAKRPKDEVEIDYSAFTDFSQKLEEVSGEAE